jgi:transketolase
MIQNKKESNETIRQLIEKSAELRHTLLDLVHAAGSAHIGGALSSCDVVTAVYYHFMHFSREKANDPERDRFVLSKGHCADLLYCVFADMGSYTKEELFKEFKHYNGRWGEHPNRLKNPGFEVSTGALGHGLPLACGMAAAARIDDSKRRVYCLVGDGEMQEGSNWEALMFAAKEHYGNLVLVLDNNGAQGTRLVNEFADYGNFAQRITNFGWDVRVINNGNDMTEIYSALTALPESKATGEPVALLLKTRKGCGVDFFENDPANCHAASLKDEKLAAAHDSVERELAVSLKKLEA